MVQKSGVHQLRLVVYPTIYKVSNIQTVVVWDFWTINSSIQWANFKRNWWIMVNHLGWLNFPNPKNDIYIYINLDELAGFFVNFLWHRITQRQENPVIHQLFFVPSPNPWHRLNVTYRKLKCHTIAWWNEQLCDIYQQKTPMHPVSSANMCLGFGFRFRLNKLPLKRGDARVLMPALWRGLWLAPIWKRVIC